MTPNRHRPSLLLPAVLALTLGATAAGPSIRSSPREAPASHGETAPEARPSALERECGAESPGPSDLGTSGKPYQPEKVSFSVRFQEEVSSYRVFSLFALPQEPVELDPEPESPADFEACASGGELVRRADGAWRWRAPERPGLYKIVIRETATEEAMRLNAFVMRPYAGETQLGGYRIGSYRKEPLRDDPNYAVPRGMVEVTPEIVDTWVSPHFRLSQFLCKQEAGLPKMMVLRSRLLSKLEGLLEHLNARGIEADTFAILSGFRTPWYNQSIGNTTSYSRHAYGDAADIYVDRDSDGRMDDLNGDGKIDRKDAKLLYDLVEQSREQAWYRPFVGGLGLYGPKPHRGPFVHVDTRGFRARW